MATLRSGLLFALCCGGLPAQAPPAWRSVPVAAVDAVVFALRWAHGFDGDAPDESGAAAAVAEYRLARARRAVPDVLASGATVAADATVVHVLVPATAADRGLAFCRALLDDAQPVDADLAAVAIARTALAADDADGVYPGPVLAGSARRALLTGGGARGVAGSAAAIQALTPARLQQLLAAPVAVHGIVLGACGADGCGAAAALPLPTVVPGAAPPSAVRSAPPAAAAAQPHRLADGPIVALAFAVPGGTAPAAFALAVEVARQRAARALPLQGREGIARAPLVTWSGLHGDPVLVFCRRGPNGTEPAAAFAELDALVADLRARPPTAAELDTARRSLRAELGLSPLPPGTDGAALPGRAVALLLAELRSVDEAALDAVTPAAAQAALAAVVEPRRAFRGALVPARSAASR
ncbi:MAG: hypothetical protein JNL08_03295 [Planctomycetes bacterium]|nr:hypothetical protein [Planctomycetota bacterium]